MKYDNNKEAFYTSQSAMNIVDQWTTGIPFLVKKDGALYDAFLFYSGSKENKVFHEVKMLVLANVETGELIEGGDGLDVGFLATEFSYTEKPFATVDEYLDLREQIEEAYQSLRDRWVSTGVADAILRTTYLKCAERMVPEEIVERIYRQLSPELFATP